MSIRRERQPERKTGHWQQDFTSLLLELREQPLDRRTFLRRIKLLLAAGAFPLIIPAGVPENKSENTGHSESNEAWKTLQAVHDHLFPANEDAPGARQLNATASLLTTVSEPQFDPDNREFIRNGIGWLNQLAQEKTGKTFSALDVRQREKVLRQIEKSSAG